MEELIGDAVYKARMLNALFEPGICDAPIGQHNKLQHLNDNPKKPRILKNLLY